MDSVEVKHFYDASTGTFSYVVAAAGKAIVIDPVMDFSAASGRLSWESCDAIVAYLARHELTLSWILETHAHADHLSGCHYLREKCGGSIGIGEGICEVQATFKPIFDLGDEFTPDGSQFDQLLMDGEALHVGDLQINVLQTPGHTSDSVTYIIGDAAFIGDTLFRPQLGSARCDFPGGDAKVLYASTQKLFRLPPETRLFLCHDYPAPNSKPVACVTVAEQLAHNVHVRAGTTEADFVALREALDATLDMPALIIPALQVNIRAGALPAAHANGTVFLQTPLNVL